MGSRTRKALRPDGPEDASYNEDIGPVEFEAVAVKLQSELN